MSMKKLTHAVNNNAWHSTTVICIRRGAEVAMAADGQVSLGDTVLKSQAKKIRKLHNDAVLAGFAGASADAFALFERFEAKLDEFRGNLMRSAVELTKEWRTDRMLRRLEALLIVADKKMTLLISGSGEVLEPDDEVMAIGSGGNYALTAARALLTHTDLSASQIAEEALKLAAQVCIFTNENILVELLEGKK